MVVQAGKTRASNVFIYCCPGKSRVHFHMIALCETAILQIKRFATLRALQIIYYPFPSIYAGTPAHSTDKGSIVSR